jgi:hypothetical protein
MKNVKEITKQILIENGFNVFDAENYIKQGFKKIGEVLTHRKVKGQIIESYNIDGNDSTIQYVSIDGNTIGVVRENEA